MARTRTYSHVGHAKSQPWHRAQDEGYPLDASVSENIWRTQGTRGGAWKSRFLWRSDWRLGQAAVISWMNSPGHRKNLLDPNWYQIGVGVARSRRGRLYLVQNFGTATEWDSASPGWGCGIAVLATAASVAGLVIELVR